MTQFRLISAMVILTLLFARSVYEWGNSVLLMHIEISTYGTWRNPINAHDVFSSIIALTFFWGIYVIVFPSFHQLRKKWVVKSIYFTVSLLMISNLILLVIIPISKWRIVDYLIITSAFFIYGYYHYTDYKRNPSNYSLSIFLRI